MNDVSVVDSKLQFDNKNDTDDDTIIDTDNDTLKQHVTWVDHGPQQIIYGDDSDKTDISKTITSVNKLYKYQNMSVNKPYKYQSIKDTCNGRTITHESDTITHRETPTTTPQVTSE